MQLKKWSYQLVQGKYLTAYEVTSNTNISNFGVSAISFWNSFIDYKSPPLIELKWKLQNYKNVNPEKFSYWDIKDELGNEILIIAAQSLPLLTEYTAIEGYPLAKTFWRRFQHIDFVTEIKQALTPLQD